LETNRWNYSICIATLVAIAAITNWSLTNPTLTWIGLAADGLISVMAILFCALWIRQIRDFKNLNNATVHGAE
jgi:predicted Co/Zn/Cd cation transporter (cation efflux family)